MGAQNGHATVVASSAAGRGSSPTAPARRRSACTCPICDASLDGAAASLYCCRCDRSCCPKCAVPKRYGSSSDPVHLSFVCRECDRRANVVTALPRTSWMLVQDYCNERSRQQLLHLCHATQLGVSLTYEYGRFGWASFFTDRVFLSKGANGAVYKTHLLPTIPEAVYESNPHNSPSKGSEKGHDKPVAVKTIQKSTVYSSRKWAHIRREVDALRRCQHRHVVKFLFAVQGPSEVYIVLQYVQGGDLFDWLVKQQVPNEDDVGVIARQLLLTLHYLHETCGVVHRDIKPENILLDPEAALDSPNTSETHPLYIRLADFGYAKLLPTGLGMSEKNAPAGGKPPSSSLLPAPLPSALPPRTLPHSQHECGGAGASGAAQPLLDRSSESAGQLAWPRKKGSTVASTPCGTLGFAAPEILSAYSAQKMAVEARSALTYTGEDEVLLSPGPQTPIKLIKSGDIFAAGVTIAILLTGCEPFPCLSTSEHLEAVRSGVDFRGPQWRYVSRGAKRLLKSMLAPLAVDRPSALECLQSHWMGQYSNATEWEGSPEGARTVNFEEVSRSFRASVNSLRKNDGWLFVQDATGLVAAVPREVAEDGSCTQFLSLSHQTTDNPPDGAVSELINAKE